jgi:hypothetical protein
MLQISSVNKCALVPKIVSVGSCCLLSHIPFIHADDASNSNCHRSGLQLYRSRDSDKTKFLGKLFHHRRRSLIEPTVDGNHANLWSSREEEFSNFCPDAIDIVIMRDYRAVIDNVL